MSYILDALRKSEAERRQGKVPDLGQQVQMVHKPKKKASALAPWLVVGLVLNAAVLTVVFWPELTAQQPQAGEDIPTRETTTDTQPIEDRPPVEPLPDEVSEALPQALPQRAVRERATIIVPSQDLAGGLAGAGTGGTVSGPVPHLVEMPLAFQKSIPDLVFNSHVYASEPSSRRVMINSQYLRAGDVFSGLRVERISEEGVVLSKGGRPFRLGIVRDWVSPR
jgi:general secretion pathway protein B